MQQQRLNYIFVCLLTCCHAGARHFPGVEAAHQQFGVSSGWQLSFNTQQLRSKKSPQKVHYAELAIYGKHCEPNTRKPDKIAARRSSVQAFANLRLNESSSDRQWVPVMPVQHIRLKECWQRFNVTLAVLEWQKHGDSGDNEILLITKPRANRRPLIDDKDVNELLDLQSLQSGKYAVLVTYHGRPVDFSANANVGRRRKRSTSRSGRVRKPSMEVKGNHDTRCARRHLQVRPSWLDIRIVAPQGNIDIYRCAGTCQWPITSVPSSSHAMMEAIHNNWAHLTNNEATPGPCCVPIQLLGYSLLAFTPDGRHRLKTYPKLLASRCGCR